MKLNEYGLFNSYDDCSTFATKYIIEMEKANIGYGEIDAYIFKVFLVIYKDTANNSMLWIGDKSQNTWYQTDLYLDDL